MTLNILFFTITISKKKLNGADANQQEMIEKLYEEYKDRQISIQRYL